MLRKAGNRLALTAAVTGGAALATGGSLGTLAGKANKAIGGEINKLRGIDTTKPVKPKAHPAPKKLKL